MNLRTLIAAILLLAVAPLAMADDNPTPQAADEQADEKQLDDEQGAVILPTVEIELQAAGPAQPAIAAAPAVVGVVVEAGVAVADADADADADAEEAQPAVMMLAAPAVRIVNGVAGGDEDPTLAMLMPVLQVELSLAKRVCKCSDDEFAPIVADALLGLKDFAKSNKVGQQQVVLNVFGVQNSSEDLRTRVEEVLRERIAKSLNEQQRVIYQQELASIEAFKKQAIIDTLVGMLDERLMLDEQQRQKIAASMAEKWKENWAPDLAVIQNYGTYLPQIPPTAVVPHLNAEQKQVWSSIQRTTINFGDMGLNTGLGVIDDVPIIDPDAKPAGEQGNAEQAEGNRVGAVRVMAARRAVAVRVDFAQGEAAAELEAAETDAAKPDVAQPETAQPDAEPAGNKQPAEQAEVKAGETTEGEIKE